MRIIITLLTWNDHLPSGRPWQFPWGVSRSCQRWTYLQSGHFCHVQQCRRSQCTGSAKWNGYWLYRSAHLFQSSLFSQDRWCMKWAVENVKVIQRRGFRWPVNSITKQKRESADWTTPASLPATTWLEIKNVWWIEMGNGEFHNARCRQEGFISFIVMKMKRIDLLLYHFVQYR